MFPPGKQVGLRAAQAAAFVFNRMSRILFSHIAIWNWKPDVRGQDSGRIHRTPRTGARGLMLENGWVVAGYHLFSSGPPFSPSLKVREQPFDAITARERFKGSGAVDWWLEVRRRGPAGGPAEGAMQGYWHVKHIGMSQPNEEQEVAAPGNSFRGGESPKILRSSRHSSSGPIPRLRWSLSVRFRDPYGVTGSHKSGTLTAFNKTFISLQPTRAAGTSLD